jgi:hypothetical protein
MSDLDIFNLDSDAFVTKSAKGESKDLEFYKPYPEDGKDGVYKALIRFLPNPADPKKSKIHKYYVYLKDPQSGDGFSVDCPSTVGKKSILKDIFWKLKNSHSAADQETAKSFSRKEDYYSLVQIVQDKNRPELEGKIMIWKFGKKINDMIEAQLKPEYGEPCNPFDLFEGRLFGVSVRKVGEWNNYDLCQFVGERMPVTIDGVKMEKTKGDMEKIVEYLKTGPQNLASFDYKDWDDALTDKVMSIIRSTVPDGRVISDIMSGVSTASSTTSAAAPVKESSDFFNEVSSTKTSAAMKSNEDFLASPPKPSSSSSSSLEDLYADL